MAARTTQAEVQNEFRDLAEGIVTLTIPDPLELDGKSYTKAQIAQILTGSVTATSAANAAKAAAQIAVATAATQRTQALELRELVHTLLEVQLGKTSPILVQLGFVKAQALQTLAAKAAAADKGKATRAARNTMGPKQRAKITRSAVTVAPAAAPSVTPVVTPVTGGTAAGTPVAAK